MFTRLFLRLDVFEVITYPGDILWNYLDSRKSLTVDTYIGLTAPYYIKQFEV